VIGNIRGRNISGDRPYLLEASCHRLRQGAAKDYEIRFVSTLQRMAYQENRQYHEREVRASPGGICALAEATCGFNNQALDHHRLRMDVCKSLDSSECRNAIWREEHLETAVTGS
jgi:hypothetical protein